MNDSNYVVSEVDGRYSIGTGVTNTKTGLHEWGEYKKLVIPSIIDGKKIEEISLYAFYAYTCLEEVIISDGIKEIKTYAFGHCENLNNVIISPSVERIEKCGIHCLNHTLFSNNSNTNTKLLTSSGVITITFLPKSNLKYLEQYAISRKENIVIYFLGYSSPQSHSNPFYKEYLNSITVYSSHVKYFGGIRVKNNASNNIDCSYSLFIKFTNSVILLIVK